MDKVLLALKGMYEDARKATDSPLEGVKRVYIGDPITIQENTLPAIVVHPVRTRYIKRGTRYDQKIHSVDVKLVYNWKDYFGEEDSGETVNITDATFTEDPVSTGGEIEFTTESAHGYSVGDGVYVTSSSPSEYNGTYEVLEVTETTYKARTNKDIENEYVGSGISHKGKTNTVFAAWDAVKKAEQTNSNLETISNTICGVVEKNPRLNYAGGNNAETSNIDGLEYTFNGTDRPFPSFEVLMSVDVTVIANR